MSKLLLYVLLFFCSGDTDLPHWSNSSGSRVDYNNLPKLHRNMASVEQDITAAISEDDMAGDADDDLQTSNYGTRSDPELDSDSDGDLTATM